MLKRTQWITACLVLVAWSMIIGPGRAQAEVSPQQKLMAKRAAELDAYRKLAERILGLQIKSDTTVRDFVTESDRIATKMDHFIKGVRITDTRYFDDGSAEIDAEVTIKKVVTHLKKTYDEVYKGDRWKRDYFEDITTKTKKKVLKVTGAGAPRVESDIPDPADEEIVVGLIKSRSRATNLPEIYSQYPPAERLKAKRAAELDAYRKLMERIYGLEISSNTTVRDFVTENDVIHTRFSGELKGARISKVRYAPDGVVEVEVQITLQQVVTTIKRTCDEVYKGGRWTRDQFEDISKRTKRKVITVLGTGALDTERFTEGRRDRDDDSEEIIEYEEGVIVEYE